MEMNRRGLGRTGCMVWVTLGLLIVALVWKSLEFFIFGPAEVKAALNDAYDSVRLMRRGTPVQRRETFVRSWEALYDSTGSELILRASDKVSESSRRQGTVRFSTMETSG